MKSRDTRAMNCDDGTRERPTNLFILVLPCRSHHPWLSRTSLFLAGHFTQTLFHSFLHKHMCTPHSGQDLRPRYACIDPTLSLSMVLRGMLSERVGSMHACMHYVCSPLTATRFSCLRDITCSLLCVLSVPPHFRLLIN